MDFIAGVYMSTVQISILFRAGAEMNIDTMKNKMLQFHYKCCFWAPDSNAVSRTCSWCQAMFTKAVLAKTFAVRIELARCL